MRHTPVGCLQLRIPGEGDRSVVRFDGPAAPFYPGRRWGSTSTSRQKRPPAICARLLPTLQPRALRYVVGRQAWLPKSACSLLAETRERGSLEERASYSECLAWGGSALGPGRLGRWRQRTGFVSALGRAGPAGAERCAAPAAGRAARRDLWGDGSCPGNSARGNRQRSLNDYF